MVTLLVVIALSVFVFFSLRDLLPATQYHNETRAVLRLYHLSGEDEEIELPEYVEIPPGQHVLSKRFWGIRSDVFPSDFKCIIVVGAETREEIPTAAYLYVIEGRVTFHDVDIQPSKYACIVIHEGDTIQVLDKKGKESVFQFCFRY